MPSSPRDVRSPEAEAAVQAFATAGGDTSTPAARQVVAALGEHAPALLPLAVGDPTLVRDVLAMGLERRSRLVALKKELRAAIAAEPAGDDGVRRALRRSRHRHVVRLALREILRLADVDATSAEMSGLAAATTDVALEIAAAATDARFGSTRGEDGVPVPLTCLGMGKLGGWELNLGSDVDLCFFYGSDDGEAGTLTIHEHHARTVARAVALLSDVTEDGFAFRVDLRLRPEGTRGPLVNSLASTERYYESWGRTWERAALLRSRPIAGDRGLGVQLLDALRPFVFRRTVDPSIADEMAAMLERSRRELHVDPERDVKLGRGGIREAEFFVQTLQLVWGGRHPSIQVPGTIAALRRLEGHGLVREGEARLLAAAWARMRRIEHRVHVWSGYQTHRIPESGPERERFARSLGYEDAGALEKAMHRDRARIAQLFDSLSPTSAPRSAQTRRAKEILDLADRVAAGVDPAELAADLPQLLSVNEPHEAAAHLARLARRADAPFGAVMREREPELAPRLLEEVGTVADPDAALRYLADFSGRLRGWSYERLLSSDPRLVRRLVGLFGTSGTLASALIGHPEELDLLLVDSSVDEATIDALHSEVREPLEKRDAELVVAALRRAKRGATLRVGLALAAGELTLIEALRLLSSTAERQVRAALELATRESEARFGPPARGENGERASMVVLAMGKLGARELGFGGDLDLAFLYDEDGETEGDRSVSHAELFTRVAQRTMRLLSEPDAEGSGYATDTRLRPSGSQGTLVVSLAAFDRYHTERGAAWERQALLRARPVAGERGLAARVAEKVEAIAYAAPAPSRAEVAAMRARIQRELASETPERLHPKLGHGGLVDVEFLVQALQMERGAEESSLRERGTLEAIAALAKAGSLSSTDAEALSDGFSFLRSIEQTLRLLDEAREPTLRPGSRTAQQVARRLAVRDRDGHDAPTVLVNGYRRATDEMRAIFERVIGPVGIPAPWAP